VEPERARERLVDRLEEQGRVERASTAAALRAVPRHLFLPDASVATAYADRPQPIGDGQTISAPHAVAWITDELALSPDDRVLEIGTGCGYHAAVTAAVLDEGRVWSVEYRASLVAAARERLVRLGCDVSVRHGDGAAGWPAHAPYDAAYLTCAAASVPDAVVEQVRPGGRVVAPVGTDSQRLVTLHVEDDGVRRERHGAVRFVRMADGE
jgi:protein-L-isoaspartate(D-aspartate) O-methyltransferase